MTWGVKTDFKVPRDVKWDACPYAPVACCSVKTKDVLMLAAFGRLYKFQEPYNWVPV